MASRFWNKGAAKTAKHRREDSEKLFMQPPCGFGCEMDGTPLLAQGRCQNRKLRRVRYGF
jgi:hypothetical protein